MKQRLTRKEEELMKILWKLKRAFVKDLIAEYNDPKPHYNTISSLVRLLQDKGLVGFKAYGTTYEYYPLLLKEEYRKSVMSRIMEDYFDNSYKNAVAFFVSENDLSPEEQEELIQLIKKEDLEETV